MLTMNEMTFVELMTLAAKVGVIVKCERGMWSCYNAAVKTKRPLLRFNELDSVRHLVLGLAQG